MDGDKVVVSILVGIGVWVELDSICTRLLVGALVAMVMNIKDPQVHAMALDLPLLFKCDDFARTEVKVALSW